MKVKGRILENGQPYKTPQGWRLDVRLIPVVEEGKSPGDTYPGYVDPRDNTFTVKGSQLKGVPPGKYRVALALTNAPQPDAFGGAFSPRKSPIVREVTSSKEEIIVDVGKERP